MVKKLLARLQNRIQVRHLALDGHFGNNNALQMVRQCDLHLISKLRCDSKLHFIYDGEQKKNGRRKRYGERIDYRNIPEKYPVETRTEGDIEIRIYHTQMLHSNFAQSLNVVILTKTNTTTGVFANVNLFSSDLDLSWQKIIDWYSLRFQIEFNFRDAKQHWGLEDFMNVKDVPLTNALNLSLFMVNVIHGQRFSGVPARISRDPSRRRHPGLESLLPGRQILRRDHKKASAKTRTDFIGADFRPGRLVRLYSSC
jgi:putative transposase